MRFAIIALVCAAAALAQVLLVSPSFVVEGKVVKGVPYTAQAVTSNKQTLATGGVISTEMTAQVARDAEGRTRREQTIGAIGPWFVERSSGEGRTVIVIQDPVKGVNYTLDPRTHLARVSRQRTAAESEQLQLREERRREEALKREPRRERSESLGERTMEGVRAEGKKTVTTFPPGSVGNTEPIEIIEETWYSPELQVVVRNTRSDPRVGVMTYRLISIRRGDPPASLFEVPAEYHVETDQERREPERRKEEPRKEPRG
jgi:hypothetical protein